MLTFPIQVALILSCLQRTFLAPRVWSKPLGRAFADSCTNLTQFNYPSPNNLGVRNEVIRNKVFKLWFMPLFWVGKPIITLYPNHPKRNAAKEVPNLNFLNKVFRDPFPKKSFFFVIIVIVARSNPTKLMHDVDCPCSLGLDGVPNRMLILLTNVREEKKCTSWNGNHSNSPFSKEITTCDPMIQHFVGWYWQLQLLHEWEH